MQEATLAGFLDEMEKIGAPVPELLPALGDTAKSLLHHGKGLLGGATAGAKHLWGAARKGSVAAAEHLEGTGTRLGRAGGAAMRLAPYAGAAYLGQQALNSQPVQSIRARLSGQPQMYQGGY